MDTVRAKDLDTSSLPVAWKHVSHPAGPGVERGSIGALRGFVNISALVAKADPKKFKAVVGDKDLGRYESEAAAKAVVESHLRAAAAATVLSALGVGPDQEVPTDLFARLRAESATLSTQTDPEGVPHGR